MGLSANEIGSIVFRIQAEDLASASLERIGASLNGLAEQSRLTGGAGGAFVDPSKAGESTAAVARVAEGTAAAGEAARESEGLFGTLGEKFKETAGEAAAFGLSILGIEAASGIFESLKASLVDFPEQIDKARITFETFTGSAAVAGDLVGQIEGLSTSTPFTFTGLADAAKTLVALGTPADQITGKLKDIAAAVAAVGGGDSDLRRIALTLARIQDAGTLTALTMRQLQTEQIPGWQILEDALGKTHEQIAAMLKTGQITSDVFQKAFDTWATTTAGDALTKQADTITGSLTRMQNASQIATSTALAPLTEQLTKAADAAARLATSPATAVWAEQFATDLARDIAAVDSFVAALNRIRANPAVNVALQGIDATTALLRGDFGGAANSSSILSSALNRLGDDADNSNTKLGGLLHSLGISIGAATTTGTKSPDLFPGLDTSKTSQFDALTKGTADATGQGSKAFQAYSDSVTAAQPGVDALKLAVGELGNTFGLVAAEADKLTASQDALAAAATAKAAALTTENVDMLKEAIGQTGGPFALTAASADELTAGLTKTSTALSSVGSSARATGAAVSAMDSIIAGTSQRLAGVQLQIEEKRLGRLESRPATSLGQQEALLQEQLRVEQLAKQAGLGPSALRGRGFASGGSFMVGGSGGTDSQLVQFWASPDETVSIARPGGSYGGGGGATTISVASIFSGPVTITKEADEQRLVAAMTSAFQQFTAGGGRPQRARDRRSPGAQQ